MQTKSISLYEDITKKLNFASKLDTIHIVTEIDNKLIKKRSAIQ